MGFNKKLTLSEYSIRPARNGYVIRANFTDGNSWDTRDYIAGDFDELVGILTQVEVESGK